MKNNRVKIYSAFILIMILSSTLFAQASNYISNVRIGDAKEKTAIKIMADLTNYENISSLTLAYRPFGSTEFIRMDMIINGNTANATINEEYVLPPSLEYYIFISLKTGEPQTYPMGIEQGVTPLQITIQGVSQKDKEIIVLSPQAGEIFSEEDALISISFFNAPDNVDISRTKLFINDEDITSKALFAGDMVIVGSENIPIGFASSKVLRIDIFDKEGNSYHSVQRSFQVVTAAVAKMIESQWKTSGSIRGEARNESFESQSTFYKNLTAYASLSDGYWSADGNVYVTSEERATQQPFNRFSLNLQGGDWLKLKAGDSYPRFPNLILDGKRVRGFSGEINLGFINVNAAYGETERSIEGTLLKRIKAQDVYLDPNVIPINQSKYGDPYGLVQFGTFNRNLLAVRPSFGSGESFQFGLSYLHSKDDTKSIDFGIRPQENIVVGTDLMFGFDNQNILFTSQAAVSVINKDIATGSLTDAQIDEVFGPKSNFDYDVEQIKKFRDIIGNFITFNQYLGPLNPQEFASLAAEAALSLNYLNNSIKASYIYRGNDYQSFGQSFIRTDVKGINIVDRIRMFDNKVFISVGYEKLEDNLQKTKIATTSYQTINASVSVFPRADFPNITVGFNRFFNNNGLLKTNAANGMYAIDDITNRVSVQMSYDLTLYVRHSTSLTFSTSNREDNGFSNSDASFNAASFNINSYWAKDLSSVFGFAFSSSKIMASEFKYLSLNIGGRYYMLDNKLLLSAMISPSFGDYERLSVDVSADYNVLANLNLMLQARMFRIPGKSSSSIIGLVTRFTF